MMGRERSSDAKLRIGHSKRTNLGKSNHRSQMSSPSSFTPPKFHKSGSSSFTMVDRRPIYEPPVARGTKNYARRSCPGKAKRNPNDEIVFSEVELEGIPLSVRNLAYLEIGRRQRLKKKSKKTDEMTCFPFTPPKKRQQLQQRPQQQQQQQRQQVVKKKPQNSVHPISSIMGSISQSTQRLLEKVGDFFRKRTAKARISVAIVIVRAVSQQQLENDGKESNAKSKDNAVHEIVSEYGLALFFPLHNALFKKTIEDNSSTAPTEASKSELESSLTLPVDLVLESVGVLEAAPRILTPKMMQQLSDEGLPDVVKLMRWKRAFSILRDGDSFHTFLRGLESFRHTIIVARTSNNIILGGYVDSKWEKQGGGDMGRRFFGSGRCFLFSNASSLRKNEDSEEKELNIFKWSGANDYCQVCDVDEGQLAMGGGGAFGLIVQDNFTKGSTGRCSTFNNPSLTGEKGAFHIVDFEAYGFLPCKI